MEKGVAVFMRAYGTVLVKGGNEERGVGEGKVIHGVKRGQNVQ